MPEIEVDANVVPEEREAWVEPELVVTSLKDAMSATNTTRILDGSNTYS